MGISQRSPKEIMVEITFMQPSEQCGSYDTRAIKTDLEEGEFTNLDKLGPHALKWGAHAYCGRIIAPIGTQIECYTNWDASGVPKMVITGNGHEQDIWDYHNRCCSFRVKLAPPMP